MTSDHDRSLLLRLAREAIAAHVGVAPPHVPSITGFLAQPGGAFVTIRCAGDLRGCIGHIEPTEPIGKVVPRCAVSACSSDPRFPPIAPAELAQLDIEISLLGPLEAVSAANEIEIGRHGLLVEQGWQRGLLLPQVATEWNWDADTFLAQTCRKAGLPREAWQQGALVWKFEAEVFGESSLRQ